MDGERWTRRLRFAVAVSTEVWAPTHRTPAAGAACWPAPDPAVPSLAARLDPGLEVRLVERRADWAQVECSNGWTAWVDARPLEQLAPSAPPPPPPEPVATAPAPSAAAGFRASHVVPPAGLAAFAEHDAAQPAVATLDPDLPVQVLDRWGDWAQIACSNGWTAWVDGRRLVDGSAAPAATAAAVVPTMIAHRRNPVAAGLLLLCTAPRSVARAPAAVGMAAALGAVLVAVGSALPLLSADGLPSVTSWDTPAAFLVSDNPVPSDLKLGVVLVIAAALVLVPLLSRRALPPLLLLVFAAPATNTAVHLMLIKARTEGYPNLGPGTLMIGAGGLLIAVQAGWWMWRERRRAFQ